MVGQLNRYNIALLVLVAGVARNYGWLIAEPELRGIVSKSLGAAATLCLLFALRLLCKSGVLLVVLCWYAFEETQTLVCSVLYAIEPWPVRVGESICSDRIGFDIGSIGIFMAGALIYLLASKNERR